jgi:hypothetical protein
MRTLLPALLLAACSPQTGLQVPDELGDIDWKALPFATATVFDSGTTSGGLQKYGIVIAISDRADLCDFTEPQGSVGIDVDVRMVAMSMTTTEVAERRYVSTTRPGPGMVDGPADVAIMARVIHQMGSEYLVRALTDTTLPKASLTIDELSEDGIPITGAFSFKLVQDRGSAQPFDVDANDDGMMDYRELNALVEGTFVDAVWCQP